MHVTKYIYFDFTWLFSIFCDSILPLRYILEAILYFLLQFLYLITVITSYEYTDKYKFSYITEILLKKLNYWY